MQSFETKVIKANKILKNIRGYLWEKWYQKKINFNSKRSIQRKFLERSKKS